MRAWQPEEDLLIHDLVEEFGTKWAQIQKSFTNRTVASIRNRHCRIKKGEKLVSDGAILKNKCHACGQLKRGHVCKAKLGDGRARPTTMSLLSTAAVVLKTQGLSVEGGPTEEGEPNIPLVLKDLFPNDSKALEQAMVWMKDRKNPALVAGHLASLSEAVETQVKNMQIPLPLPPEFFPALKVTMPLSAYLASEAKKAQQAQWPTS